MRSLVLIAGASLALIAAPALAQSTGNAGGLLSASNAPGGSTSQSFGGASLGAVSANPQLGLSHSHNSSSTAGTGGTSSHSFSTPLTPGGAVRGRVKRAR